jgi:drug/metabolite transporter (DMT)-like permease
MVTLLRDHPLFTAYVALICLCFFWGTTYLGIRIALESFPPATLVCVRNLLAGGITLTCGRLAGAHVPAGRELWVTAGLGLLILGAGNGALAVAETWIPSGLAALFIATAPFWYAGAEAIVPGGEPLRAGALRGMLIGSAGVALLIGPAAVEALSAAGGRGTWAGFCLLQASQASWVFASIVQRRQPQLAHPFISGAVQQLATGVVFALPAFFERPAHWDWRGLGAVLYLAVFGGIVGYSCFTLVMSRLPVAIATLYTYVNPVVAVILGWLVYREPFGWREGAAMAVIFLGVALVRRASAAVQQLGADGSAKGRKQGERQE